MNEPPKESESRTQAQNNSLHKYCQMVADALNGAGYSVEEVLKNFTIELDWTKENVKEILWRTAQKRMLGKTSTTQLLKQGEIDTIHEAMTRFLGERLKIEYIPWPSIEILEQQQKE